MTETINSERQRQVDEWRIRRAADLLTLEQVRSLPQGTTVEVVWSGGNGPHCYSIDHNGADVYLRPDVYDGRDDQWAHARRFHDPISFVGRQPYHTQVAPFGG